MERENIAKTLTELEMQILGDQQHKFGELLWFARKGPNVRGIKQIKDKCDEIIRKYPLECELLWSDEDGDWQHGFHSGCYALLNVILMHPDVLDGMDDFPFLDT